MTWKRLETTDGSFRKVTRESLAKGKRAALVAYLEARGTACYDDESTALLREAALEDYDGESSEPKERNDE